MNFDEVSKILSRAFRLTEYQQLTIFDLLSTDDGPNRYVDWFTLLKWIDPNFEKDAPGKNKIPAYRLQNVIEGGPLTKLTDRICEQRVQHVVPMVQDNLLFIVFENQVANFYLLDKMKCVHQL